MGRKGRVTRERDTSMGLFQDACMQALHFLEKRKGHVTSGRDTSMGLF